MIEVFAEDVPALVTVFVSPVSTSVSLVVTLPLVDVVTSSVRAEPVSETAIGVSFVPWMVIVKVDHEYPVGLKAFLTW